MIENWKRRIVKSQDGQVKENKRKQKKTKEKRKKRKESKQTKNKTKNNQKSDNFLTRVLTGNYLTFCRFCLTAYSTGCYVDSLVYSISVIRLLPVASDDR